MKMVNNGIFFVQNDILEAEQVGRQVILTLATRWLGLPCSEVPLKLDRHRRVEVYVYMLSKDVPVHTSEYPCLNLLTQKLSVTRQPINLISLYRNL